MMDWARLLDLDRSGDWVAESDAEDFLDAVCARHDRDRETLKRHIGPPNGHAAQPERGLMLAGTYACYSHAWSPYFRGRVIRGELSIGPGSGASRLQASYAEVLPTGRLSLEGSVSVEKRAIHLDLRERGGDAHFVYFLFPPTPPVSVLAGLMCGTTIIGPVAQPSVTRIAMVRLPAANAAAQHRRGVSADPGLHRRGLDRAGFGGNRPRRGRPQSRRFSRQEETASIRSRSAITSRWLNRSTGRGLTFRTPILEVATGRRAGLLNSTRGVGVSAAITTAPYFAPIFRKQTNPIAFGAFKVTGNRQEPRAVYAMMAQPLPGRGSDGFGSKPHVRNSRI